MRFPWPQALPLAILLLFAGSASSQTRADLDGTWLIRRVSADELSIRVELSEARAVVFRIGRLGRWEALPEAIVQARQPVSVETGPGELGVRLQLDAWHAELVPISEVTALWVAGGAGEVGVAHRVEPVPPALLGAWVRAELHPSGPRLRDLLVEDDAVTTFNSRGRATRLRAMGLSSADAGLRLALLPEHTSGQSVELLAVPGGYLALEVGGDRLEVIYPEGQPPEWLGTWEEPSRPTGLGSGELDWLMGRGGRERLIADLHDGESASWRRLGPGTVEPVRIARPATSGPWQLTRGGGGGGGAERYQLWVVPDGVGAIWSPDEDRYWHLWAVTDVPRALVGSWRVRTAAGEERVIEVGLDAWTEGDRPALPIVGVRLREDALGVAVLEPDRSGRLVRFWPLPDGRLIGTDGAVWEPAAWPAE